MRTPKIHSKPRSSSTSRSFFREHNNNTNHITTTMADANAAYTSSTSHRNNDDSNNNDSSISNTSFQVDEEFEDWELASYDGDHEHTRGVDVNKNQNNSHTTANDIESNNYHSSNTTCKESRPNEINEKGSTSMLFRREKSPLFVVPSFWNSKSVVVESSPKPTAETNEALTNCCTSTGATGVSLERSSSTEAANNKSITEMVWDYFFVNSSSIATTTTTTATTTTQTGPKKRPRTTAAIREHQIQQQPQQHGNTVLTTLSLITTIVAPTAAPASETTAPTCTTITNHNNNQNNNFLDELALSWIKFSGAIVSVQFVTQLLRTNKIFSYFINDETMEAVNTIRTMFATVQSQHGVETNLFTTYKPRDVLVSIVALSRLQRISYHIKKYQSYHNTSSTSGGGTNESNSTNDSSATNNNTTNIIEEATNNLFQSKSQFIQDVAHYSTYAHVAYGWQMDLAVRGRIHLGSTAQFLLRRLPSGLVHDDIIKEVWDSKTNRPAYFIVRDTQRKVIVVCIRGTWTAHDVLTDLCCETEVYTIPTTDTTSSSALSATRTICAHKGMFKAAQLVKDDIFETLSNEFTSHNDTSATNNQYELVLVGHSMGGSVAALLGLLLEESFPNRTIRVYGYGPACVVPFHTTNPMVHTTRCHMYSIIMDGDPFRCISLGHVAELSQMLLQLCSDPFLLKQILLRTNYDEPNEMPFEDLHWCRNILNQLRQETKAASNNRNGNNQKNMKLYPPGQLYLVGEQQQQSTTSSSSYASWKSSIPPSIRQVPAELFEDWILGTRMLDVSRHVPSLYESYLTELAKTSLECNDSTTS